MVVVVVRLPRNDGQAPVTITIPVITDLAEDLLSPVNGRGTGRGRGQQHERHDCQYGGELPHDVFPSLPAGPMRHLSR